MKLPNVIWKHYGNARGLPRNKQLQGRPKGEIAAGQTADDALDGPAAQICLMHHQWFAVVYI